MRSRLLRVASVSPEDVRRWSTLAADAVEPNVFYEPEFLRPTQEYFGEGSGIALLVVEDDDGSWLAALPLELVRQGSRWPWRHASNAGPALYEYTSSGVPLIDRHRVRAAVEGLVDGLLDRRRPLGHATTFHLLPEHGPGGRALLDEIASRGAAVHVWGTDERAAVDYGRRTVSSWQDLVSTKRARVVRRRLRLLRDALGGDENHPARLDVSEQPVAEYLDYEMRSWKGGEGGPAFARRENGARWWTAVFEGFRARGDGHLLSLHVRDNVAYMGTFLSSGSHVYCMYDAYAPELASFSPGSLSRLLVNEHFAREPRFTLLDTCMDPSRYPDQTQHYPDRVTTISLTVSWGPFPFDAVLRARVRAGRWARRARATAASLRDRARRGSST